MNHGLGFKHLKYLLKQRAAPSACSFLVAALLIFGTGRSGSDKEVSPGSEKTHGFLPGPAGRITHCSAMGGLWGQQLQQRGNSQLCPGTPGRHSPHIVPAACSSAGHLALCYPPSKPRHKQHGGDDRPALVHFPVQNSFGEQQFDCFGKRARRRPP